MNTTEILTAALVVANLALVVVTIVYTRLTNKAVQAARDQTEALTRPYLIPRLVIKSGTSMLVIKNEGNLPARNAKATLNDKFRDLWQKLGRAHQGTKELRTARIFTTGITSFPPQDEIIFHLFKHDSLREDGEYRDDLPRSFSVTMEYEYLTSKEASEETIIDLQKYDKSKTSTKTRLEAELQGIKDGITKQHRELRNGFKKLKRAINPELVEQDRQQMKEDAEEMKRRSEQRRLWENKDADDSDGE